MRKKVWLVELGLRELSALREQFTCLFEPTLLRPNHTIGQIGINQRSARVSARMFEEFASVRIGSL